MHTGRHALGVASMLFASRDIISFLRQSSLTVALDAASAAEAGRLILAAGLPLFHMPPSRAASRHFDASLNTPALILAA